jgi:ABC-2 type transport system ATP-binding protein
VRVLGFDPARGGPEFRARIGIVLQQAGVERFLTVEEVLELFRGYYENRRSVDELLRIVGLEDKRKSLVRRLSGGQVRRLDTALALAGDPELLFLDEPTSGFDPAARRDAWEMIAGLRDLGKTILLTTHYMDEAERLCDRVAVVDRGRVIALGTPRELVARHAGSAVVEFAAEGLPAEAELAALPGVRAARRAADGWALTAEEVHRAVPALLALLEARGAALLRLSTHQATLDDVFVALTGRQLRE